MMIPLTFVRRVPNLATSSFRLLSSLVDPDIKIRDRMFNFINLNPNLSDSKTASLDIPPAQSMSFLKGKFFFEIVQSEPNFVHNFTRTMKPGTREKPILIGSDEIRKVQGCICMEGSHYARFLMLYRDLAKRCFCGSWYQLVDMETFELEKEKHWATIKDESENVKLLKRLKELEDETNLMFVKWKQLTSQESSGGKVTKIILRNWMEMLDIYKKIRQKMFP